MLSPDTQNLLARILLSLAEGERKVEDARKDISSEDDYDIQAIFRVLDNNEDNYITPKDIQKYLNDHGLEVNFPEVKLLILFYDQDHDFSLTYGEIFKIVHPGKEFPKIPKYRNDEELNAKVDAKLYNLLEKEILMARIVLALLDEIKHKRDFNIHSAFHALKYYACITGDSINMFLNNCGMKPTAGDVRAIVKRLDINKDEIIDFCEFHAFLGFPDCTFCCPCFPCGVCGAKYCQDCLQDIPCYLLGCDHKGMDSKMKCTSFEHNPGIGGISSLYNSIRGNYSPSSTIKSKNKFFSQRGNEENEKNDYLSERMGKNSKNYGKNVNNQKYPSGIKNIQTGKFYTPERNGYNRNKMSQEQFKLLQGLTNPEQLNKFMKISDILDRQNNEEINLTNNLSLRLSPIRDFDPKEWGCRNCPCNIHSNPNVPCDCCSCNVCPFKSKNANTDRQKQLKFPKNSIYSYSYSYEPDTSGPNQSFLSTAYGPNSSIYIHSPKRNNIIFDKETNKYMKVMPNSSDDEEEIDDYMIKVNNLKDTFDRNYLPNNKRFGPPNSMIYSDRMSNNKKIINNITDVNEEEENNAYIDKGNIYEMNENEDEENIDIRKKKLLNQMYRNEENIINQKNKKTKTGKKRGKKGMPIDEESDNDNYNENENVDDNDNNNEEENINNFEPEQDPNRINNFNKNKNNKNKLNNNNFNTYGPSKRNPNLNPNQNYNNNNPNINKGNNTFPNSFNQGGPNFGNNPNNINNQNNPPNIQNNINNLNNINNPNNPTNSPNNLDNNFYDFYNKMPIHQSIYGPSFSMTKKLNDKNFISGSMEEESEDDLSSNNFSSKSFEEIIDEEERRFLKYLKALIKSEREIEFAKRDLMRQKDFNAEDAFRLFEVEGTGVVTKNDLIFGLKLLGIKAKKSQIDIIFNKYDLDGNNFLEYDDFFDMVISFKHEDRKDEEKRKHNKRIPNRRIEIFSPPTRALYKKLFLVIIEEEERLEELKQKLNINEIIMNGIFNKINVDKDGLCDKYEFAKYCLRNKICKEKKDAYLAFIRLNRNRDGGLESKEFSMELKSSILGQ